MDAGGKQRSGLFSGNRYWTGAVDQCRQMEKKYINNLSIVNNTNYPESPPFQVTLNSANLRFQIFTTYGIDNFTQTITLGLCLPAACRSNDVVDLLNFYNSERKIKNRNIVVNHVRNLSEGYTPWEDSTFYIIFISSAFVCLLIILGTTYDIAMRYRILDSLTAENGHDNHDIVMNDKINEIGGTSTNNDERGSVSTISKLWSIQQHNASLQNTSNTKSIPQPMTEALLSFSLLVNISKLTSFDVGHDTLAPIHGLRFISMLWIILVHTCLTINEVSDTNTFRMKAEEDFLYQTLSNGTYAVDTFFFISGCLVTFLYFRTMSKRHLNEKKITQGPIGKILQFLGMMFYRYFRITPPYLLVIGLIQVIMKWHHAHSMIELPTLDYKTCEKFWWRNALYINTYFDMDERCMVWSWYLANDTQFYTFGIIILIISASYFSIGAILGFIVLIASWITTMIITINTQHVPTIEDPFSHYASLYDKPWTRIGPYLIGMATGWYLYKTDCKLKINKTISIVAWILSLVTMLSIVYGIYGKTFGPISSAMYTALSHSGWACCIAWILIACVTRNGGLIDKILACKYLYPLSRLTYCAYLVHPALTQTIVLYSESSFHLSQPLIAIIFFGITVASYAVSLVLSLAFEAPMVSFLRIFHPLRKWKLSKNSSLSKKNETELDNN